MNTLLLQNVSKTYAHSVKALNDISLTIPNGMFGLLGPNGAGKSTLMRTLAGLQLPDTGRITLNGVDLVANPTFMKQQLGYLPQDFGVYPGLSAYTLMDHLAVLKGIRNRSLRKEQILALLDKTNLYAHRNKAVSTFSGGMRQRFGIAQALLGDPQVIIVDEPTAGLDPEERNRFNTLLCEIGQQIIVILSTHLVEDVRNLCTHMAIMQHGSVIAAGKPDAFVDAIAGKVWSKAVQAHELIALQQTNRVVSTRLHGGKPYISVYADTQPDAAFTPKSADLEDVYFITLHQNTSHVC
ncbi:ABC transporter ATP-binding protein [Arsenicibacter rosenii]|uniref:Multidrug ABC transporter ATP-binding protein n=1 Tax=Arsenicibacter rosenii TaxID=1750698 RepID=A0A1S2VR76_9BACT|nr:ABC transporter ATP-binding protein [Arsenicibacter rosenii]OIN60715.1 multidrug ABC transporter ATP-binding protein [Arsenicibacter rosenii]